MKRDTLRHIEIFERQIETHTETGRDEGRHFETHRDGERQIETHKESGKDRKRQIETW